MRLNPLFPALQTLGINTDLYELTMAAAYFHAHCVEDRASFELFTRELPQKRNFLMAAGLEQALHFALSIRFTEETVAYLRALPAFERVTDDFFDYLLELRFTGDVHALPEGTIFFSNEPILQVTAPIIEAQILETYLINSINYQSMIASKAARLCLAGNGKSIVGFGSRRAHSPQAGVLAARASFIGGCAGTSNVWAGYEMGIPVYGTMAHSFVQFFDNEWEAFQRFYEVFGENSILLVDTYDTLAGVEKAAALGAKIGGVRLDSGDLLELAFKSREYLNQQGRQEVRIVASGDLNEDKIRQFVAAQAPIDSYGIGTELVVSADYPTCDLVYKLVEVERQGRVEPRIKASEGKATLPYRKQVFRRIGDEGFAGDMICKWGLAPPQSERPTQPLLQKYIGNGQLVADTPDLSKIRDYAQDQISRLPEPLKLLDSSESYPVEYSRNLLEVQKALEKEYV